MLRRIKSRWSHLDSTKRLSLALTVLALLLLCVNTFYDVAWGLSPCSISRYTLTHRVSRNELDGMGEFGDALKPQLTFFDELWAYEDFGFLSGSAGYVTVRFGFPIGCVTTVYS